MDEGRGEWARERRRWRRLRKKRKWEGADVGALSGIGGLCAGKIWEREGVVKREGKRERREVER